MQLDDKETKGSDRFPSVENGMVDRLSNEASDRTQRPQVVDWAEIHRQAELVLKKGD